MARITTAIHCVYSDAYTVRRRFLGIKTTSENLMKNIILLPVILLLLSSCDSIEDMSGMFEKQEQAQSIVKDKYGWTSQLGFNMHNGQLTQVTLVLNSNDVGEKTVNELEKIAREVVAEVFKSKPRTVFLQIQSTQENESLQVSKRKVLSARRVYGAPV